MKIVVTGASGFLGSAVVRLLTALDNDIVAVSRQRLPGFVHVKDYAEAPAADVLIHLAESAVRDDGRRDMDAYQRQMSATWDALLAKPYRRVVYASSAVLYGDRSAMPRRPQDEIEATDAYTRVKRRGEMAALQHRSGAVARLANLFGPGMSPRNVISTILRQIPGAGPLRVRDTAPVRDFLWINDAADALVRMAVGAHAGVFNVGSGRGHSVGEVAALALDVADERGRPVIASDREMRPSWLVLDISATSWTFGWSPATDLREGLVRMLRLKDRAGA